MRARRRRKRFHNDSHELARGRRRFWQHQDESAGENWKGQSVDRTADRLGCGRVEPLRKAGANMQRTELPKRFDISTQRKA